MESFSYCDLLQRLEAFDAWLISLGLTPRPNDRVHEAFKVLRKANDASRKGRETGNYSEIQPGDWFPVIEALEAHDVLLAFQNDPSPAVGPSLKRALSGPLQPIHETSRNREGRNIWFEFALAAEWRLRGASVALGEPDLRLTQDDVTFLVACKRPTTTASIETNLRDAVKQIRRNLDGSPSGTFGVAAISLSCAFNRGDKVFSGEISGLGKLLEDELDRHRPYLRSISDPRICCVLFEVATPAVADGVDLLRASFSAAQELHPSIGSKTFEKHGQAMRTSRRMCE
jgi:hypothetical protein